MPIDQCHQEQPYLTQVKFIGSFELPWQWNVSAAYQNNYNTTSTAPNLLPGQPRMGISANWVATNAQIAPELGRNLAAGANANATINVITPGTMWGDRVQQPLLVLSRRSATSAPRHPDRALPEARERYKVPHRDCPQKDALAIEGHVAAVTVDLEQLILVSN